ncbi:MAG: hypothetical protein IJ359_02250 [Erysipelotrichaceae bacterium]|nr:hypothetical protein [Erysipelotrichaceae bacterium]
MIKLKISYERENELQDFLKHLYLLPKYQREDFKKSKNKEGKYKKAYIYLNNKTGK